MKILICGKGGCGKSTTVALLAKEMAVRKSKVLVIDNDESNIGLHSRLGMEKPEDFMNYFGGKKVLFERTKGLKDKWKLADLPRHYLTERGNIQLLSMGKIYQLGEGCACPINALSSKFLEILDLLVLRFEQSVRGYPWTSSHEKDRPLYHLYPFQRQHLQEPLIPTVPQRNWLCLRQMDTL
jgi:CO dehydrogenase nickel-insertion accessory protein CooC1